MRSVRCFVLALLLLAGACAHPAPPAKAGGGMVAAANPLAVEAGLRVLREGGSAADAAVAIQAVLGLVEPQSSGLGGGAFMTYYDARAKRVLYYDGRETAPKGSSPEMFLNAEGRPLPFGEAVTSGRATGVPGAVVMLGEAQRAHGKLPWSALFKDAERLADKGFVVSPRLAGMIASGAAQSRMPDVIRYFTKPDGSKYLAGDVLKNPAYAETLRTLAAKGPRALIEGPIAEQIVARTSAPPLAGTMTLADLSAYRPKTGAALCRPYRAYVVCAPPAPSGGPAVLLGLGILARTDIDKRGPADPQGWFLLGEAERLMYADRDRYMGDPAFVEVPTEGLLDPAYLDARAALIGEKAMAAPKPGKPRGAGVRAPDATLEPAGTSHFVVADAAGNVVSMTTTVESLFGTGRMVGGFFVNNQLTDFSFQPKEADGAPAANAVDGGKRPRSSMAPVVVTDRQGRFVAALGSPGGSAIPSYNLKTLVALLDWKLSIQEAIDLPNLVARGQNFSGEADKMASGVVAGLAARGVTLRGGFGENSGLHGVAATPAGLQGGADPRREGVARAP